MKIKVKKDINFPYILRNYIVTQLLAGECDLLLGVTCALNCAGLWVSLYRGMKDILYPNSYPLLGNKVDYGMGLSYPVPRTGPLAYVVWRAGTTTLCHSQLYPPNHILKMELDLQSFFRLPVHSCTHWLRPRHPPPPPPRSPAYGLIYEGAIGQPR